ncbi:DNA helicase/exodeoxyribonuclease V, beta subunit [Singulisphaera sp. GP187]|uniref:UvrD-helicase domain-containing protein n=1 Tax=Singulisphaera sp. GP187 TaxID=1882752 RepID=UPI00092B14F1|nr:UvrD-helicase domain-containing protein [Singulisphaera sp. GP187]SIN71281.1 DNA helicase/exodeoxyribonuclease V, beta subunit [Singulisphaera sp. GP187]
MTVHYPRPAILDRIPHDRHAVIEASAGTGKTYTIEHLVIELLLREQVSIDQLLVLTFTERAAAELRQRIRAIIGKILGAWCEGGLECRCDRSGTFWRVDDARREQLRHALASLDGASIGTIHGFFARVLNEHAFAGGRLFDGTLEDGRTRFGRAFKTALRRVLARGPSDAAELLALWVDGGNEGIDGLEKLLYQCHSSRREVRPSFDLTALRRELETNPLFEIDISEELEQIGKSLKALKVHGATTKAICGNHLPAVAAKTRGRGRSLNLLGDKDFTTSLRYLNEKLGGLDLDGTAATIRDAIVQLNDRLAPLKAAVIQACLIPVVDELERMTATTGAFDFDGILAGAAAAVDGPDGESLVNSLRDRFRYALIDESQDTDELQWSFFKRVFVDSDRNNFVYLIGDPKQSIYGFRGADVKAFLTARARIVKDQAPATLGDNHRSTPDLIAAYNLILDGAASPPFLEGEITYQTPVKPGRKLVALARDGSPSSPVHVLEIGPRGESLSKNELFRGLARQIAREAAHICSERHGLRFGEPGEERPVRAGDIFILTASNSDGPRIAEALRDAGVPFAFYKQEGLFQTAEASAVRDLLAAIDDPADVSRRSLAWITPFFSVPLDALPDLFELPDSHPLLRRLIDWKDLAEARRFETLFARILDESGIVRRELLFKDDERALTNYLHLFEFLLEEVHANGDGLSELVATLDAYLLGTREPAAQDGNVQRLESDRDAVQIMTIHKSKGLEAAVVFLYGGFTSNPSDGLYEYHDDEGTRVLDVDPDAHAKETAKRENDEERQRLYYVALTRAKARLYLPFVPNEHMSKYWTGGYRRVNDRLAAVLDLPEASRLFHRVPFRDEPIHPTGSGPGRSPATWRPHRHDLEANDESSEFAGLRDRHRAYEVTSYSRMKRDWVGDSEPIERDEHRREPGPSAGANMLAEGDLPGGRAVGTFLHEIIEAIPLDETATAGSLDAWRTLPSVAETIDAAMARNAIESSHRAHAEAMIYHALTADVPVGADRKIPGFCRCQRSVREMEFLFPFPEEAHPGLADPRPGKLVVERGFIKGFVDLVVEHDGLVYVADWKGDVLPSYDAEAIMTHVAKHYELQAKLYALALVKALRVHSEAEYDRRFGGMIYVFLRAARQPGLAGHGLYFARPAWSDLLQNEADLIRFGARPSGGIR